MFHFPGFIDGPLETIATTEFTTSAGLDKVYSSDAWRRYIDAKKPCKKRYLK